MKKLLLFGFDSLLNVLALETAVSPLGVELVPVARKDYNKPLAVLAGMEALVILELVPTPKVTLPVLLSSIWI